MRTYTWGEIKKLFERWWEDMQAHEPENYEGANKHHCWGSFVAGFNGRDVERN